MASNLVPDCTVQIPPPPLRGIGKPQAAATSTTAMAILRVAFSAVVVLLFSAWNCHGLQVNPNSPCASQCSAGGAGTTESSIVCLDSDYSSTSSGSHFQQCVECELGSSAANPTTGTTDVMWGLYNLRYALSACMFGFPVQMVSLSSPCQVTCTPLSNAIESGLGTNATTADLGFCNTANFSTTAIQQCVFCYGLMDEQKYLANFLQALNIACQDPPSPTNPFPVAASSIFNSTTIQPPTISSPGTSGSHHLHGTPLILAIALPIVFGFLLLVLTCIACFFSARRRRRQMASRGKMRRVHDAWADSPSTPRATHFDWEQAAMDMEQMKGTRATQRYSHTPQYNYRDDIGPGTGQVQDHALHDQYFAPVPQLTPPYPGNEDGIEMENAVDMKNAQHVQQEPPNFLHSPVDSKAPYEIGVARSEAALGDKKDGNRDWI